MTCAALNSKEVLPKKEKKKPNKNALNFEKIMKLNEAWNNTVTT